MPANFVARWDGTAWHAMGDGLPAPAGLATLHNGQVVAEARLGQRSQLYAWSGSQWQPLGPQIAPELFALVSHDGTLWAGTTVGTPGDPSLRRLNNNQWVSVETPFVSGVTAATVIEGELYVAGGLAQALPAKNAIARWNPRTQAFDLLPGQFNNTIRTLSLLYNRELFVGGSFTTVNGQSSVGYARLSLAGKPWIAQQPTSVRAPSGGSATLRAFQATGYTDATVHWLRNGQPLTDGALPTGTIVLGSQTRALRLSNLSRDDDGAQFQMVVTSPCGSDTSEPATLTVLCTAADIAGPGNSDPDGALTADDLIRFVNWFFDSDLRADIAGTGQSPSPDADFTSDDLIAFVNTFFTGCD